MAGAFDDDVGLRGRFDEISAVDIGGAEVADHLWFAAFGDEIEHIRLVTALHRQQSG